MKTADQQRQDEMLGIISRAFDAFNTAFNRVSHIWGDGALAPPYFYGRWQVARYGAVMACRDEWPALAAALWSMDDDVYDALTEVESVILQAVNANEDGWDWTTMTPDDMGTLDGAAATWCWCGIWRCGARPSLEKNLPLFLS